MESEDDFDMQDANNNDVESADDDFYSGADDDAAYAFDSDDADVADYEFIDHDTDDSDDINSHRHQVLPVPSRVHLQLYTCIYLFFSVFRSSLYWLLFC